MEDARRKGTPDRRDTRTELVPGVVPKSLQGGSDHANVRTRARSRARGERNRRRGAGSLCRAPGGGGNAPRRQVPRRKHVQKRRARVGGSGARGDVSVF